MISVSEKPAPTFSFEGLGNSLLVKIAADWLQKELQRASLMSKSTHPETAREGSTLLSTLLELTFGNFSERFMDAVVMKSVQEKMKTDALQSFVYGRLGKLAMFEEFSRENADTLFRMVFSTSVTPWIKTEREGHVVGGPTQVYMTTTPDAEILQTFFKVNHWLLLLIFVINAFQLMGYDNVFLSS